MKIPALFIVMLIVGHIAYAADDIVPSVSKGTLQRIEHVNSKYVSDRYLNVWLPPGYSSAGKYDVLYMHDGRMLFDANTTWNMQEWQVDEVAGALIEQQLVRPFIVVGIPNAGGGRHSEYFPQQPFESLSEDEQSALYALYREPDKLLFESKVYSDNYIKFILLEVAPLIESLYPVNPGGAHRYIAGSSMGGLVSWYALLSYPMEFAGAICMSTHWPGTFSATDPAFAAFARFIQEKIPELSTQKIYFDYGDATLDVMYPPLQRQIDQLFINRNYPANLWMSKFFPGENHSEGAWSKRLTEPLEFMFGLGN